MASVLVVLYRELLSILRFIRESVTLLFTIYMYMQKICNDL